ncbi:PREDICTED: INO80 complex subunit D isoform X1 [Nelumbo nucifera]|uniref:KAT8 regulatory NSL complex subunit 2 n=2 Tax=Nelumbo nucifera TaxID=4432 RepID=A0A822XYG4_NELNU|nr:PREDICTED: INO80 complex subunit D isoform X1 [Nelumbo nucifera]DAD25347.1 TPA_asm: hypothetical protein HUJ06_026811 [Nelumbo nucifera]
MGSANKHHHRPQPSSTAITVKDQNKVSHLPRYQQLDSFGQPTTSSDTEERNPNPNTLAFRDSDMEKRPLADDSGADAFLCNSNFLTRQEVIRRRSRRVKQLAKCYKDHYWALMEELKVKYREYYWKYGKSPFKEEDENDNGGMGINGVKGSGENNRAGLGLGPGENNIDGKNNRCAFPGCKAKAMALTNYCQPHILSDSKQKLYKACTYVIKSAQTGPILCGKPILRSTVPSLCMVHFQKAQKHVTRALKKAGLNISSSTKLAPKFHVIVAEAVHQIQTKRRAARRATLDNRVVKESNAG